jgi:hypothetical protein
MKTLKDLLDNMKFGKIGRAKGVIADNSTVASTSASGEEPAAEPSGRGYSASRNPPPASQEREGEERRDDEPSTAEEAVEFALEPGWDD